MYTETETLPTRLSSPQVSGGRGIGAKVKDGIYIEPRQEEKAEGVFSVPLTRSKKGHLNYNQRNRNLKLYTISAKK